MFWTLCIARGKSSTGMTGPILILFFFPESLNTACGYDNLQFLVYGPVFFLDDDLSMTLFLTMCVGSHDDL